MDAQAEVGEPTLPSYTLTDTTVWLCAVSPAPGGATLWHDRRPRPFSLTRRTRSSEEEVAQLWSWVRETLDLPADLP